MQAFYDSLRGIPFDDASQRLYQDRINALEHRAQMATDLGSIYDSLTRLSSYDAPAAVEQSAKRLSKEVSSIPAISGSGVDPSNLVGNLASDLAKWAQTRDLQKGSRLVLATLESIDKLFQNEERVYKAISTERSLIVANVMSYMIEKKMVSTNPLLERVPQSLGLSLSTVSSDEVTTKAIVQLARVRLHRLSFLSADAADSTKNSISLLIKKHREFQAGSRFTLNDALASLQHAQTYLDEISELRSGKKQ
jgi:hypothetical protein